jgi:hypothetical protein
MAWKIRLKSLTVRKTEYALVFGLRLAAWPSSRTGRDALDDLRTPRKKPATACCIRAGPWCVLTLSVGTRGQAAGVWKRIFPATKRRIART